MSDDLDDKQKNREDMTQLRQTAEKIKMQLESMVEIINSQSHYMRARYLSLIAVGFTAAEALEIIKARGWQS